MNGTCLLPECQSASNENGNFCPRHTASAREIAELRDQVEGLTRALALAQAQLGAVWGR